MTVPSLIGAKETIMKLIFFFTKSTKCKPMAFLLNVFTFFCLRHQVSFCRSFLSSASGVLDVEAPVGLAAAVDGGPVSGLDVVRLAPLARLSTAHELPVASSSMVTLSSLLLSSSSWWMPTVASAFGSRRRTHSHRPDVQS